MVKSFPGQSMFALKFSQLAVIDFSRKKLLCCVLDRELILSCVVGSDGEVVRLWVKALVEAGQVVCCGWTEPGLVHCTSAVSCGSKLCSRCTSFSYCSFPLVTLGCGCGRPYT